MTQLLTVLSIPSPSEGVWHLGPLPLRAYAFAIILGVFAAVWTGATSPADMAEDLDKILTAKQ